MSEKVFKNNTLYLKDIIINKLPDGFRINGSLNCLDCELSVLPKGLNVTEDLIIDTKYIKELPKEMIIGRNIIMEPNIIPIPNDALIGGKIISSNKTYVPPLPKNHYIILDSTLEPIIYKKCYIISKENFVPNDYYLPEIKFYKNINKDKTSAVEYREKGITYILPATNPKDAKYQVDLHRAKINGIDKYINYDIYEPRKVSELKQIYQICTSACETGIKKFLIDFNIDENKKYTLFEVTEMLKTLPSTSDNTANKIFINFFGSIKEAN